MRNRGLRVVAVLMAVSCVSVGGLWIYAQQADSEFALCDMTYTVSHEHVDRAGAEAMTRGDDTIEAPYPLTNVGRTAPVFGKPMFAAVARPEYPYTHHGGCPLYAFRDDGSTFTVYYRSGLAKY